MELVVKKYNELTLDELYEIIQARISVFVIEQNCPYQDLDNKDKNAYHVILRDNNVIKGYLRVLDKGVTFEEESLGRVITTERGKGYSIIILKEGIKVAKEKYGAKKIRISAQLYAKGVYEKVGFKQVSGEYLEDGIPHIQMLLELWFQRGIKWKHIE